MSNGAYMLYLKSTDNSKRKYRSTNKVCYLVLDIGIPQHPAKVFFEDGIEETFTIKDNLLQARKACKKMGIKVRAIEIRDDEKDGLVSKRYVFHNPYYRRDDEKIVKASESFLFSLSLYIPVSTNKNLLENYCFPSFLVHENEYIIDKELIDFEKNRPYDQRILDFPSLDLFSDTISGGHYDYIKAWKFAIVAFYNPKLFNAIRFFRNSQKNFYVFPGQLDEIINNPNEKANNSLEQNIFEDTLLNSFKAVEAIIGHLPKKDKKLFSKLYEISLDPYEMVGYGTPRPIYIFIREMEKFRDTKSAHGSNLWRDITVLELLNFQEFARTIVYYGFIKKLGDMYGVS